MKILHVIPSVSKVRGGTSQVALSMVKALRENNVNAEIITTNDNHDTLLNVSLNKLIEYEQVPIRFFQRFSPKFKIIREFAFSWQLTVWLWQNISKYDILHVHAIFSYASTMAMLIARKKNVPYIVIPHGLLCEWSLQQKKCKKQIYLKLIEQANLESSQAVHFTSQKEQQEAEKLRLNIRSFVLRLGISLPNLIPNAHCRLREYLEVPADEPVILFMSRLHPKKGLDYLIPALGKLASYRFTFVIAGSGSKEYQAEINSLLSSYGIDDRTHFIGFVEGETKNILIQGSDLFVLTSHSENFAVVVLEALAVGTPVLITLGVALASLVKQFQLGYVSELNVSAIASALNRYFSDPQAAQNMVNHHHKFILEHYTWETIAIKMSEIYQDILSERDYKYQYVRQFTRVG
ncbi:glycosyltransferase [Tolypothrix sp. PCC 7910]|uniref:glycosyltransferase n=1 Tax=Tolypothrix sp. PCC 7910 TaxID=2099387 RepID=UPI0014278A97|nr:glycosyltransferase [Tolypothrix sp. PCC 7910]QIR40478.1 glycosyltransferase [Tolypothrix sp. PCC 7910]